MRSWFARRPSPAMVVAAIALIVGFSGSALAGEVVRIAKGSLPGNRLKERSVSGDRIKRNSLTSAEIAESRLSKVPLAARADLVTLADRADLAASALNANTVDGVSFAPIHYDTLAPGDFPQTIFDRGGLRLTANCAGHQLSLVATATAGDNSTIAAIGTDSAVPATTGGGDDTDFGTGDTFDVAAAVGSGDGDEVLGRLIVTADYGWAMSVDLWLDETAAGCRVSGAAMGGI
jgi:hypothetical protein